VKPLLTITLAILFLLSCSKEKETIPVTPPHIPEQWEKFIGYYNVYDTLGNYKYQMEIQHYFSGKNIYGNDEDSLVLQNFADTFDIKYEFRRTIDPSLLSIGIFDSIVDKNNKSWSLSGLADDIDTPIRENKLLNDTIILYFQQTNIQYHNNEAQPYYYCKCKHVAVKQ